MQTAAPSKRILRQPEMLARVGLSRMQVWRLEKEGQFPKRLQLGANSVGWIESDVDAWIDARTRGSARAA